MQFLHAWIVAYLGRERVAVHFRHLDVGDHHQEFFFGLLAFVHQFAQVIQGLTTIIEGHHVYTNGLQAACDLLARH